MKSELFNRMKGAGLRGFAFGLGLCASGLVAATVSGGWYNLTNTQIRTNFDTLKSSIEKIDPPYSTGETLTHKVWIDGRPIYRKVIDTGSIALNAGQNKTVPIQVFPGDVVHLSMIARNTGGHIALPGPLFNNQGKVQLSVVSSSIHINCIGPGACTGLISSRVIVEYTR